MGDFDQASRWLAHPLPETIFSSRFGAQYLYGRGSLFLATGRLDAALSDFTSCGELVASWDMDLPAFIPWRTAAAAVYLAMGRQDAARSLIDDQLARPGAQAGRVRGITLRLLAAASKLKDRPALLNEAIDLLQAGRDRLEVARAVVDLGQAQHALGQMSRARMTYRFAETVAKQCCAKPLLIATRLANRSESPPRATARTLNTVDGATELSDAERRVAALAVRGDSNGEIARRLFITVSTVEQHLTRVYRKLNVTGRTQLPASLSKLSWEPGLVVGPVDVLSSGDRTATRRISGVD
jgi:DNA-binding CsgD family transcriptional regulator